MTTATLVTKLGKNIKAEMPAAIAQINLDGYTANVNQITDDESGDFYPILFYHNDGEVIAVPDFYIGEAGVTLRGSRGGEYELNGETLVAE